MLEPIAGFLRRRYLDRIFTRDLDPHRLRRHRSARPGRRPNRDAMEITSSTAVIKNDCHMKIVSVNGITPVIVSKLLGTLAGLACSCAADEDMPIAQVAPSPR